MPTSCVSFTRRIVIAIQLGINVGILFYFKLHIGYGVFCVIHFESVLPLFSDKIEETFGVSFLIKTICFFYNLSYRSVLMVLNACDMFTVVEIYSVSGVPMVFVLV